MRRRVFVTLCTRRILADGNLRMDAGELSGILDQRDLDEFSGPGGGMLFNF